MNENILKLKVDNKDKNLEKYLKTSMVMENLNFYIFCFILIFVVKDLEIDFIKLVTDSSKYFGDILSRMLPPDFSNLNQLFYAMFETIEIAFLGTFLAIVLSIPLRIIFSKKFSTKLFCIYNLQNYSYIF